MKTIIPKTIKDQKVVVPGSKSISHRMLICASLCTGISKIENLLESEDIKWTMNALTCFGAQIDRINEGRFRVTGRLLATDLPGRKGGCAGSKEPQCLDIPGQ